MKLLAVFNCKNVQFQSTPTCWNQFKQDVAKDSRNFGINIAVIHNPNSSFLKNGTFDLETRIGYVEKR